MADDRIAALEDDVTALRSAYHALLGRLAVLETRGEERAGEGDRLRAVELTLASLRARVTLVGMLLSLLVLPVAVRLLLGGGP